MRSFHFVFTAPLISRRPTTRQRWLVSLHLTGFCCFPVGVSSRHSSHFECCPRLCSLKKRLIPWNRIRSRWHRWFPHFSIKTTWTIRQCRCLSIRQSMIRLMIVMFPVCMTTSNLYSTKSIDDLVEIRWILQPTTPITGPHTACSKIVKCTHQLSCHSVLTLYALTSHIR